MIALLILNATPMPVRACTRVLFVAKDGTIITGRSMDWGEDLRSNMWVLPRGLRRDGMGGKNSISWESKYGSLIVSGYDIGTSDGMNEKGLVVNVLALAESDYRRPPEGARVICMSTWANTSWTTMPPWPRLSPTSREKPSGSKPWSSRPANPRTCTCPWPTRPATRPSANM